MILTLPIAEPKPSVSSLLGPFKPIIVSQLIDTNATIQPIVDQLRPCMPPSSVAVASKQRHRYSRSCLVHASHVIAAQEASPQGEGGRSTANHSESIPFTYWSNDKEGYCTSLRTMTSFPILVSHMTSMGLRPAPSNVKGLSARRDD